MQAERTLSVRCACPRRIAARSLPTNSARQMGQAAAALAAQAIAVRRCQYDRPGRPAKAGGARRPEKLRPGGPGTKTRLAGALAATRAGP